MLTKEEVAEILLDIDAVELSPARPFKYASGILSPIYVDCRLLASYPTSREAIVESLVERFSSSGVSADIVVGTGSSAISLATQVALRLGLPMAFVRPAPKGHGRRKQIEGLFEGLFMEGLRALLISDIMSTEADIPNSIKAIQEHGGKVAYCLSIFSNNIGIAEGVLRTENIPFYYLADLETLLRVASLKKKLSASDRTCVEEWMADPTNWDSVRRKRLVERMDRSKREISEILLKIGAVAIYRGKPFRFASGILSPLYTDHRLLMSYPAEWQRVMDSFLDVIVNEVGVQKVDVIAGTAMSGITHAAYLADRLSLPMAYVKLAPEDHGKRSRIEGRVNRGDKVLLVEDLVTTGASAISAVEILKEAGATIEHVLAIFTYDQATCRRAFEKCNVRLIALSDLNTLLDVGEETARIDGAARLAIKDWARDPLAWSAKHEADCGNSCGAHELSVESVPAT